MSFDFTIPLHKDDLRRGSGVNQYVVDEVLPVRILPAKLQECRSMFRTQGAGCIQQSFDSLFSILYHLGEVQIQVKEDVWELLVKATSGFANSLVEILEGEMDPDTRKHHLNTLKMVVYLLCQFAESFEVESSNSNCAIAGKGRGKKAKKSANVDTVTWDAAEREKGIRVLFQLLQLPVQRLWDPPVAEEEFVNLVTNCGYKMLENPEACRDKPTRDAIIQLLGVMVKRYNHGLGCSLKMMQLLQHFEHLAGPLAQAIEMFVNDFGIKTVVAEVMREISRMDARDLARDTSGTRAYAAFLVELAERVPSTMMPFISVITVMLDGESYTMRNSVLSVLGEMVIRVLSQEGLDDKHKQIRDQFLDKLEDHIHDVHAFVRSRALQIWLRIVNEKALPLPRQGSVVELVIGRLEDKSSIVRKHAIQLLTALLRTNPFAAKLSLEELEISYEKEKEKLKELMPDQPNDDPQAEARAEAEAEWKRIEKAIKKTALKLLGEDKEEDDTQENEKDDTIAEDDTVEGTLEKLVALIKAGDHQSTVKLLAAAQEAWPQNPALCAQPKSPDMDADSQEENEKEDEEEDEDQMKATAITNDLHSIYIAYSLRRYIVDAAEIQSEGAGGTTSQSDGVVNEITKQQVLVQYLKDSMTFVSQIQKAIPVVCQLLGSKNISDILEAIDFFVTGAEFGVEGALTGVRRMLVLVWSKEQGVKDAVVAAYKRLYLNPEAPNARAKAVVVVSQLTALTVGASLGDVTSLEEMLGEFVRSGELDSKVIQTLWERFSMKIPNTSVTESRGALLLLAMAAGAEADIVRSNIEVLVSEGLGQRAQDDFMLARDTCSALLKLVPKKKARPGETSEPFRLPQDHDVFQKLSQLVVSGVTKLDKACWVPMAEMAVNVIYKLAENPDAICGEMIKSIANIIISYRQPNSQQEEEESQPGEMTCPSGVVTRLVSIAGQVALRQLVHLDVSLLGELKRRQNITEAQKEKCQRRPSKNDSNTSKMTNMSKSNVSELTAEEELGMAGASADDAEAEYIRHIAETDIVTGTNLLAVLRPLVTAVCNNQAKYSDPELQAAATLTLAKFMLVSSEFCDGHLQLLFTILEKSSHPVIRANTIIALGDLTFRFPNLIEPWTPHLYARLRDESQNVRKNTLMVLTHLILNDMVKVKGQISELATCIVDRDPKISGLAKLFFHELAKKGNAVYNIMPDVISRLSDPEIGVEEDYFRTIMRYLFSFIQKDRQCESLVEKLCHRFRATICDRQWRDLSFCLSLLSYSEKSIRKLQENFACYADKLGDEDVYNSFVTIMNGAKKFAKPEAKALVDELEERIEKCHSKGMDDDETAQKASKASAAARNRGARASAKTPARKKTRKSTKSRRPTDSDEEDVQASEDEDFHPARRQSRRPKLAAVPAFSDDEEADDLFEVEQSNGKSKEVPGLKSSDVENADPNTSITNPKPKAKTRHRSVNAKKPSPEPTPRRTRPRRSVRNP